MSRRDETWQWEVRNRSRQDFCIRCCKSEPCLSTTSLRQLMRCAASQLFANHLASTTHRWGRSYLRNPQRALLGRSQLALQPSYRRRIGPVAIVVLCRQGLFAVEQRNLLFLLACPQLASLFATLLASFSSLHTSPHAPCAPLLTPLCAGHRGARCGGLRGRLLGLGI